MKIWSLDGEEISENSSKFAMEVRENQRKSEKYVQRNQGNHEKSRKMSCRSCKALKFTLEYDKRIYYRKIQK